MVSVIYAKNTHEDLNIICYINVFISCRFRQCHTGSCDMNSQSRDMHFENTRTCDLSLQRSFFLFLDYTDKRHYDAQLSQSDSYYYSNQFIKRSAPPLNLSEHNCNLNYYSQSQTYHHHHQSIDPLIYLPNDFTLDETRDLSEHTTGPLSHDVFQRIRTISTKLSQNKCDLHVQLTEDQMLFIR